MGKKYGENIFIDYLILHILLNKKRNVIERWHFTFRSFILKVTALYSLHEEVISLDWECY